MVVKWSVACSHLGNIKDMEDLLKEAEDIKTSMYRTTTKEASLAPLVG